MSEVHRYMSCKKKGVVVEKEFSRRKHCCCVLVVFAMSHGINKQITVADYTLFECNVADFLFEICMRFNFSNMHWNLVPGSRACDSKTFFRELLRSDEFQL